MASEPRYISVGAIAHGERRAASGGDQQLVVTLEHEGERERPAQMLQRPRHRHLGVESRVEFARHPQRHGLRVRLRLGRIAVLGEVGEQFAEVLDDAVVHHGDALGRVRMGIVLGRRAMRRPARMADADEPAQGSMESLVERLVELALGPPPRDPPRSSVATPALS
jgi:hypothetical protein